MKAPPIIAHQTDAKEVGMGNPAKDPCCQSGESSSARPLATPAPPVVSPHPCASPPSSKLRRGLKWSALSLLVLFLVPGLQVGCVRMFDPPTTGPITVRWMRGKLKHLDQAPLHRQNVKLEQVPASFLTSVWTTEDPNFFDHHGFDFGQIQMALQEARASGKPPRGASTISQQCARSLFLWQTRSWLRKGLEAYYTMWMETLLSKRRILELYVNVVEMADGVYGIEAGAEHHYGIHAKELNREQAAMLVAILPGPRVWDPNHPTPRVLNRQARILRHSENVSLPIELEP